MTIFFLRTSTCKILITRTIISRLDLNAKRIENTIFHIYFLRLIMGLKKKRRATSLKQSLRRISKAYRLFYPSYFLETSKSTCEQINFQSFLSKKKKDATINSPHLGNSRSAVIPSVVAVLIKRERQQTRSVKRGDEKKKRKGKINNNQASCLMDSQLEIAHVCGTNCYPSNNDARFRSNYRRQKYCLFGDNLLQVDVLRHFIAA